MPQSQHLAPTLTSSGEHESKVNDGLADFLPNIIQSQLGDPLHQKLTDIAIAAQSDHNVADVISEIQPKDHHTHIYNEESSLDPEFKNFVLNSTVDR